MTIREALREGYLLLDNTSVETPFLDAVVLLSEALFMTKERLYSELNAEIENGIHRRYLGYLDLRRDGKPVSYIRQRKEFYGLEFRVDERVFVPRPDTETLVEAALEILQGILQNRMGTGDTRDRLAVHDVCTGSGCIAITLKHSLPALRVSASDISPEAGEIFRINSQSILGEIIPFCVSDLLTDVEGRFDVIVGNPPYLRDDAVAGLKAGGWPEPELALRGGPDGLLLEEKLIGQVGAALKSSGSLLLEADPEQMPALRGAMRETGFVDVRELRDLTGRQRVILGMWPG
ncbi:MAG TPA: peptide chain release factor N(5)-glutamine methyltransferase [Spirochaetia bacterium]|nr:peptide chain release factor N(5)-glutamine methyltransferase [Spirochaetia bacterium]